MEQYGVMGMQFILQLILARILEPEVYGVVAIVMLFIAFSNVFIQKGFSTALVQRKEINKEDISSVFFVSLAIAAILYGIIFISAPAISRFFNMPELGGLLRIMCLGLFPGAYSSIQTALLSRDINFKVVFFSSITSVCLSGGVAIWMAYKGAGVWALAIQQLLYSFLVVIAQFYQCRWKPLLHCNFKRVKKFLSFGWKVLVADFINEVFVEIRTLVIGKMYTSADLSFYNRGRQFPYLIMNSINGSLQAVLLPRFSSIQEEKEQISPLLRVAISTSYYVLAPVLVLLACCADPLVRVLLTDKWLPCVPYLQLYCIYYASWPFTLSCSQAIFAIGRSDIILKIESIRKVLDIVVLLISIQYGVFWIAAGSVLVEILSMPLYISPIRKNVYFSLKKQLLELLPIFILCCIIGILTIVVERIGLRPIFTLLVQISVAIFVYVSLSFMFRVKAGQFIWNKAKTGMINVFVRDKG